MKVEDVVAKLSEIPGVVAVTLGGSRAAGNHLPDSDWDLGVYYRGEFDANHVRALGFNGTVVDPGEWGRLVNGGAWLEIDNVRVDLLWRDIDFVSHWQEEAEAGRFEVDRVHGYVAGMATYVLVGELAVGKALFGNLPHPSFPEALRLSAPKRWSSLAEFSLDYARSHAKRGDVVAFLGVLAVAGIAAAQAPAGGTGRMGLEREGIT